MQKSDNNQTAMSAHRRVRTSTTLNRKYVKKPVRNNGVTVSIKRSPKVRHFSSEMTSSGTIKEKDTTIAPAEVHPIQKVVRERTSQMTKQATAFPKKLTAKEIKDREIQKALAGASLVSSVEKEEEKSSKKFNMGNFGMHFGFGKIMLAMVCATAAVFAIIYFVNINMPDLSAMGVYPEFVPRDYALTDMSSKGEKTTLVFNNSKTGESFTIVEEKSSWDSNALLDNYVKNSFGDNYQTIKEQRLTIYMNDSNAAWVNGGMVYKLSVTEGNLTKKQIRSIAVSL